MGSLAEPIVFTGRFTVRKFYADDDLSRATPYEVIVGDNLLLTAGASALFNRLANLGSVTAFDATNGRIAVGNGTGASTVGMTDLTGSSRTRQVFDAAPIISGNSFTCSATFAAGVGTHAWTEIGVANAASGGVLLDRALQDFGAKGAGTQWTVTGVLSLSGGS